MLYNDDEHTLGTAKYSGEVENYVNTVMADIYSDGKLYGECNSSQATSGAGFNYSSCTTEALKYSSDDAANS
jgi:hypothetical protein